MRASKFSDDWEVSSPEDSQVRIGIFYLLEGKILLLLTVKDLLKNYKKESAGKLIRRWKTKRKKLFYLNTLGNALPDTSISLGDQAKKEFTVGTAIDTILSRRVFDHRKSVLLCQRTNL